MKMGKDYRFSKDDDFDNDGKRDQFASQHTYDRNKRNKKRAKSAMSRKQRQHHDY